MQADFDFAFQFFACSHYIILLFGIQVWNN